MHELLLDEIDQLQNMLNTASSQDQADEIKHQLARRRFRLAVLQTAFARSGLHCDLSLYARQQAIAATVHALQATIAELRQWSTSALTVRGHRLEIEPTFAAAKAIARSIEMRATPAYSPELAQAAVLAASVLNASSAQEYLTQHATSARGSAKESTSALASSGEAHPSLD